MKLREYNNRFPDKNILGAIMYIPAFMSRPMALRYFSGEDVAWFVDSKTYDGQITIIQLPINELLDIEVQGWANNRTPLMDGDYVWIDGVKQQVERVKEGDGSPYPIITKRGQHKWSEISMISKEAR